MSPRPPADAVVALRSLPRRFRGLFAGLGDDEAPDDLAHRAGSSGRSAADHIATATATITLLGQAVHQVLTEDRPALPPGAHDPSRHDPVRALGGTVSQHLDDLAAAAQALADRLDHVGAAQWARPGTTDDPATNPSAADLLWAAVDGALAHRQAAEATLAEVRRQR
jgi:hypothetical protein